MNPDRTQLSIFCMVGATFALGINDAMIKFLSGNYPLHEVLLFRALIAISLTLFLIMPLEGGWHLLKTRRLGLHAVRGACLVVANLCLYAGIAAIPLAEATAIYFFSPLFVTMFSAVFLGERVGLPRWLALMVGFLGVLLIVQPGGIEFQWAMLLPLAAAAAYATLNTLTRYIGLDERASTMTFYFQITSIAVCTLAGLAIGDGRFSGQGHPSMDFVLRAWMWPDAFDLLVIGSTGVCSAAGAYLITQAFRIGESGLVAPFEYALLPVAVTFGYMIWGEVPTPLSILGMILIVGSGVVVAVRETRLGAQARSIRKPVRNRAGDAKGH